MLDIINVIIWAIAGASTLGASVALKEDVPKLIYGLTWFCLMLGLILDCIE